MSAQLLHDSAMSAMHEKRWGGCYRNQWGRLECHRNNDNNDDFFQSTGIWILVAFLVLLVILAFVGGLCCVLMRRKSSSSRSIRSNGGWFGSGARGGGGGGRGRDYGYTGNRRDDVDHGPPPGGFYATQETVYPKGDRARGLDRSRSRSLERERKV